VGYRNNTVAITYGTVEVGGDPDDVLGAAEETFDILNFGSKVG